MDNKYFKTLPVELIWKIWETVDSYYMEVLRIQGRQPGDDIVYESYKKVHHEMVQDIGFELSLLKPSGCRQCENAGARCSDCFDDDWDEANLKIQWDADMHPVGYYP